MRIVVFLLALLVPSAASAQTKRACTLDSIIMASGESRYFYSRPSVQLPELCDKYGGVRRCEDGTLYGEVAYSYNRCFAVQSANDHRSAPTARQPLTAPQPVPEIRYVERPPEIRYMERAREVSWSALWSDFTTLTFALLPDWPFSPTPDAGPAMGIPNILELVLYRIAMVAVPLAIILALLVYIWTLRRKLTAASGPRAISEQAALVSAAPPLLEPAPMPRASMRATLKNEILGPAPPETPRAQPANEAPEPKKSSVVSSKVYEF